MPGFVLIDTVPIIISIVGLNHNTIPVSMAKEHCNSTGMERKCNKKVERRDAIQRDMDSLEK